MQRQPGGFGGLTWRTGAIGVLILVTAAAAGFVLRPTPSTFPVTWEVREGQATNWSKTLAEDVTEASSTFGFPGPNVTEVRFAVEVEVPANHTGEDRIRVVVEAPHGNTSQREATLPADATTVEVAVDRTLAQVPNVSEIEAKDRAAAHRSLLENHTIPAHDGRWRLEVHVTHTGPTTRHEIRIFPTYTFYVAELGEP